MKKQEDTLKTQILNEMSAAGMKSVNIDGVCKAASRVTKVYEVEDLEKFAYHVMKAMVEAANDGRPLSEGLLTWTRPHRERVEAYIGEGSMENTGLRIVERTDLSVTKSK